MDESAPRDIADIWANKVEPFAGDGETTTRQRIDEMTKALVSTIVSDETWALAPSQLEDHTGVAGPEIVFLDVDALFRVYLFRDGDEDVVHVIRCPLERIRHQEVLDRIEYGQGAARRRREWRFVTGTDAMVFETEYRIGGAGPDLEVFARTLAEKCGWKTIEAE